MRVIFKVEEKKFVPVYISSNLPVYNPKCTRSEVTIYKGLAVQSFRSGRAYLVALKDRGSLGHFVAPEGAIVHLYHSSGSHSHTYYRLSEFFVVAEVGDREYEIENLRDSSERFKIETRNLIRLERLSEERLAELEAEIINDLKALPSKFDPVRTLYHYFVKAGASPSPSSGGQRQQALLINGFLVVSSLPSKALLDAHLPEVFKEFRIGRKEIRLTVGYFYNKLGTLSRKFYTQILPKHAVWAGFGYIVPKSNVAAFLKDVEELRREYEEYEEQLKAFLLEGRVPEGLDKRAKVDAEYLDVVMEYLRQHGVEEEVRRRVERLSIASRVSVRLLPFSISLDAIREVVDEEVRRRVEADIRDMRERLAEEMRKKVRETAKKIMRRLRRLAKREVRREVIDELRGEVERLERECRDLGVTIPELSALKELLTEEGLRKLAREAVKAEAGGRVAALVEF